MKSHTERLVLDAATLGSRVKREIETGSTSAANLHNIAQDASFAATLVFRAYPSLREPIETVKPQLTIIGRRWFERTNGNTYHSATVYLPDGTVLKSGIEYGYGNHYLATAYRLIQSAYHIPNSERSHHQAGMASFVRNGFSIIDEVFDVKRKKDL